MSAKEKLAKFIQELPEESLEALCAYAERLRETDLSTDEGRKLWKAVALRSFAKCFGPNEPEYTLKDVKRKL